MTQFEQLAALTTVVADTADFDGLKSLGAQDGTTNPSLVFQAAPKYPALVKEAIEYAKTVANDDSFEQNVLDKLSVAFGCEILKIVPGLVSTEVDARLSFDTEASLTKARKLIQLYADAGIDKSRVLIKLASTWEGIEAARVLEKEGIRCNMTLIFDMTQAVACAQAGATLISPFVGRILDWHKKDRGVDSIPAEEDPGVISVRAIYNYFKRHGHDTIVMGASFRNVDEILALAGIDRLTVSPKLLNKLKETSEPVKRILDPKDALALDIPAIQVTEAMFRYDLNQNEMATDKLSSGIRGFVADTIKLEELIKKGEL